jgi:hypothetical protein
MIVLPVQLDLKPFTAKPPRSRRIDGPSTGATAAE